MIVGTAGHIDHGKTALVKALTGVDTDRLKEEKARGITLDLGFAYTPSPDGTVWGFVDVPGHEKLVRHMLAGAGGIDVALLVVAADDGPMPQTLEHLAILDLLGIRHGVVALSKADRVSEAQLDAVRGQVRALLQGTALADAPLLPVSAHTGAGIDALKLELARLAEAVARPMQAAAASGLAAGGDAGGDAGGRAAGSSGERAGVAQPFRLSVDRAFTLQGIGTIITGTALSGSVRVGDALMLSPRGVAVRVRSLRVHDREAESGHAGHRIALNLTGPGLERDDIRRGDVLLTPAWHAPTQHIDLHLHLLAQREQPLRHWAAVHVHVGAEDVLARVALLEGSELAPGARGWAQLVLDRPVAALRGDRVVLRDAGAQHTLGGGVVVDAFASPSRRHKAAHVAALKAMALPQPEAALAALLALHPAEGVALEPWALQWGWQAGLQGGLHGGANAADAALQAVLAAVPHHLARGPGAGKAGGSPRLFAPKQWEQATQRVVAVLTAHHKRAPDTPGLARDALRRSVGAKPPQGLSTSVFDSVVDAALQRGSLRRAGPYLQLAGHEAELQGAELRLWQRLKPWLDEGGIHPPKLSDMLLRDRSLKKDAVERMLQKQARLGKVHAVGPEYYVQTAHLLALARTAQRLAAADENQRLNVKALREDTGMSRHFSMPLVEFFDQIGFTRRDPIGRKIRKAPEVFFASGDAAETGASGEGAAPAAAPSPPA